MFDINEALNVLEDQTERLSAWEREFITSVSDQNAHGIKLSDSQVDKLAELYERYA